MDGATLNERQEALNLTIPDSVAVVGCGGVGSWTALFLALAGVKELWLFDRDEVSLHNLNRLPVPISSVGKIKSQAVAEMILALRPDCHVLAMGNFDPDTAASIGPIASIVATTDTHASRLMVSLWARDAGTQYIEAAAEGEYGSVTGQPAEWITAAETQPGYASVPVWVGPCVFAASMAVAHVIHGVSCCERAYRAGWNVEDREFDMFDSEKEVIEDA